MEDICLDDFAREAAVRAAAAAALLPPPPQKTEAKTAPGERATDAKKSSSVCLVCSRR